MANSESSQINENPFAKFVVPAEFSIEQVRNGSECGDLYNGFGICWFRSVMQIFLYVEDFNFKVKDEKPVFNLVLFLNKLKEKFDLKTDCYKLVGENLDTLLFHIENLYAYMIYLLSVNIGKIMDNDIINYNDVIHKADPWYFSSHSNIKKLYVNLKGVEPNNTLINTFILLNYLLGYNGKPYVIGKQIFDRSISLNQDEVDGLAIDNIKVLSYSSNLITGAPSFQYKSTFKSMLKCFKKGIDVIVRDHHNMLALYLKIGGKYYQLFAMSIANNKQYLSNNDGHILSVMEDKTKGFPLFSGAELPTFNLIDTLLFKNGEMDSIWNKKLRFNYDLGFRECFYRECDSHDWEAYITFEKIIKLLNSPVPCKIALEHLLENNVYFQLNNAPFLVKCKIEFTNRFKNYIVSINAKIIDVFIKNDDAICELLEHCMEIEDNITGVAFDNNYKYMTFMKKISIKDLQSLGVGGLLQKAQSIGQLNAALENCIRPGSESIADVHFYFKNIQMNVSFITLLWWLNPDKAIATEKGDDTTSKEAKPSKINNFLYYQSSLYSDIISIFDIILLHATANDTDATDATVTDVYITTCINMCKTIKDERGTEETTKTQINGLVTNFVSKECDTKYKNITFDHNRFTLRDGNDSYLDELYDDLDISKQDVILYYFILAVNAYIANIMKPPIKGGYRKMSLASRIRKRYCKRYCKK